MSGVVLLANGGWATWDPPYVVLYGMGEGAVLAFTIRWWTLRS